MLLSLTGCGNVGGVRVIDTGCERVRPIYVSDHDIDVMSAPTQRQILTHNETWLKTLIKNAGCEDYKVSSLTI